MKSKLALASLSAALLMGAGNAAAQDQKPPDQAQPPRGGGRGNFDPEQFRQRMMESYREQLEATDDAEWKLIEGRIQKVMDARRDIGFGGGLGFGRGGRGGGGDTRGRRGGGETSPETEALQKAIDAKASPEELKAKLAKFRDARKEKEAKLELAQDELRKVLSVRQEAAAVLGGLLR